MLGPLRLHLIDYTVQISEGACANRVLASDHLKVKWKILKPPPMDQPILTV